MARSCLCLCSVTVLLVAVALQALVAYRMPPSFPWHEGPHWSAFLAYYDRHAPLEYPASLNCSSPAVPTRYGLTQLHVCRGASSSAQSAPVPRPVVLLHGASSNALIYGQRGWLGPALLQSSAASPAPLVTIAVDSLCDVGRSVPLNKDPAQCPNSTAAFGEWMEDVLRGANVLHAADRHGSVSVVGYSYGAFIAASLATLQPSWLGDLVLVAPAAVFAPVELKWILGAVGYMMFPGTWFMQSMMADPQWSYERDFDKGHREHYELLQKVAATKLAVNAVELSDEELQRVVTGRRTMLVIGDKETVTSPTAAAERARKLPNVRVEVMAKAGHMLLIESPAREEAEARIVAFLQEGQ